jgi:deazaflavin-dependent oxidoreductase (nitroreductase family)
MDEQIRQALERDGLIDITTSGRKSGKRHRIETGLFRSGDQLFLTGLPGRRDWYANLLANPNFTLHLKQSTNADLDARATPITDQAARRAILGDIVKGLGRTQDLDAWVENSPLAAISINGLDANRS